MLRETGAYCQRKLGQPFLADRSRPPFMTFRLARYRITSDYVTTSLSVLCSTVVPVRKVSPRNFVAAPLLLSDRRRPAPPLHMARLDPSVMTTRIGLANTRYLAPVDVSHVPVPVYCRLFTT